MLILHRFIVGDNDNGNGNEIYIDMVHLLLTLLFAFVSDWTSQELALAAIGF